MHTPTAIRKDISSFWKWYSDDDNAPEVVFGSVAIIIFFGGIIISLWEREPLLFVCSLVSSIPFACFAMYGHKLSKESKEYWQRVNHEIQALQEDADKSVLNNEV